MTAVPRDATTSAPSSTNLSPDEFKTLEREDVQAGRVIGWLLGFFFFYTIVVTILAAWWTWDSIRT